MPFSRWPKLFRSYRDARVFFISISLVVVLFLAVISFARYRTVNNLLLRTIRHEAESYASLIITARTWNASHGGVYVLKTPSDHPNKHLKQLGRDPELRAADGRTLVLVNPATMTREISEIASRSGQVRFHMISLKPINPANEPDVFERTALEQFQRGSGGLWSLDKITPAPVFRFVSPLTTERSCLECHQAQGYREGDIRGGISIRIPADDLVHGMRKNAQEKVVDFMIASGLLLAILYFLTWKLFVRLDEIQRRLKQIAITDELTGLNNRRYIMDQLENEYQRASRGGTSLAVMILDIDHFKKINDRHGHLFGDEVLKVVAGEMKESLRSYDLLGRIGGEEFLIASPGSSMDDAARLAERIRVKIKARKIEVGQQALSVTISAGVTSLDSLDGRMNALLIRADDALYQAKNKGRNRVVTI